VPQYLGDLRSDAIPESEVDPELAWSERALCSQVSPEAFFPDKGGSTREAKKLCMACDVRVECLHYAMTHGERFGIWGGLSERERERLARNYEPLNIHSISKPKDAEPISSIFQISTVHFQTFSDLSIIGQKFRENGALILDMSDSVDVERRRAIDFLSGMIFAQNGKIQKIRSNVFFLTSGNIQVTKVASPSLVEADTYERIRELLMA
jgi:WhiB family redox-sensing transcriptional regulator